MFTFLLIIAILGVAALLFYLVIELNELEKSVTSLVEKISKRYETQ